MDDDDDKTYGWLPGRAAVTVVLAVLATALLAVGFALVAAAPTAAAATGFILS
jgi:hypothetical protein